MKSFSDDLAVLALRKLRLWLATPLDYYPIIEKGSEEPKNSYLVAQVVSHWNQICSELLRWKELLGVQPLLDYSGSQD